MPLGGADFDGSRIHGWLLASLARDVRGRTAIIITTNSGEIKVIVLGIRSNMSGLELSLHFWSRRALNPRAKPGKIGRFCARDQPAPASSPQTWDKHRLSLCRFPPRSARIVRYPRPGPSGTPSDPGPAAPLGPREPFDLYPRPGPDRWTSGVRSPSGPARESPQLAPAGGGSPRRSSLI